MRVRPLVVLASLAALAIGGQALAKPAGPAPAPLFLTRVDVDLGLKLPPPPADGSPTQKRELTELHRLEKVRTPKSWARAKWDDSHEDGQIFASAIGPGFDLSKLPATAKLLADVRHEEKIAGKRAKTHFLRKRPWIVDPSLVTCSREDGPLTSYPSGHTVMAYSMATVLAAAIPPKRKAIMARAADYGHERLVCAMHFRSDILAGRTLGTEVGDALLDKPTFRVELAAARRELAALH